MRRLVVDLTELATVELTYTALQWLDYDHDGQLYGTMEGSLAGRLSGSLRLTNFAALRADGVNLPTLRGVLTTRDEATVWVELDGIATLREEEGQARVFITTFRFRTGDERYAWLNATFGSLEGLLESGGVGGVARGRLYACQAALP
jgi:hypothetical protein